jgi:hypothetical protein
MNLGFRLYFQNRSVYVNQASLTAFTEKGSTVYRTTVDTVAVTWCMTPHKGGLRITLQVQSDRPLGICRIDSAVLSMGIPAHTDRIVCLGRDMYGNETRFPHEFGTEQEYCIHCLGLFPDLAAHGTLLSGLEPFHHVFAATARKAEDGSFEFCAKTEFTEIMAQATTLCAEQVLLFEHTTIERFFKIYRALLPKSHFPMPKLTGWNTWDYYRDHVTPEDIFENVEALCQMPFSDTLRYIVIDDGWQRGWGDWVENDVFACGLNTVAAAIRNAGFIPGIWMTPVGVRNDVAVFRDHPDWLCHDERGELLYEMGLYYLDPTHPDAEQFILNNYRYQYRAGYRLFKMDYVSPLLRVKRFHDPNATPYSALARMVEQVKSATGPDAVVLGCSLPLECGADIAPSMRIAVDIHNHFSHVEWIAQALCWAWMHNGITTRIDADFMIVRGEETANPPLSNGPGTRNDYVPPIKARQSDRDRFKSRWCHGDKFNAVEAETWANLVAISGGNIFLSDRMSLLNERGISILQNALSLAGEEVCPRYRSEDLRLPSVWEGDRALLLINWEDVPRCITIPVPACRFRADKPYELSGNALTVSLLPHESFAAVYADLAFR